MDRKNINYSNRMLEHYYGLSFEDQEKLRKDVPILEKIVDCSGIDSMISQRIKSYNNAGVNESLIDSKKDIFDFYSDFYSILREDDGSISMGVRVTPRSKLGILQSELNLMSVEKLKEFYWKNGIKLVNGSLKKSTMDEFGRNRFRKLLKQHGKNIWEVGGFFGKCKNGADFSKLLLGLGQLGFIDDWKLAIQTQAPTHANYFLKRGFPYRIIADSSVEKKNEGYSDSMGRPAVTLGLIGYEFGSQWKYFLKEIKSKTNGSTPIGVEARVGSRFY